jgi:hypothetical protein
MALLQETGLAEERAHGVRGLGTDVEPMIDAIGIEIDRSLSRPGLILSDDLDELAIARALRIGDDDAEHRGLFPADATEANLYSHWTIS